MTLPTGAFVTAASLEEKQRQQPRHGGDFNWPNTKELERWMMNAAQDCDVASAHLRRLLQMHPGYGAFLVGDEDVACVMQSLARRLRQQLKCEDMRVEQMYQPICEIIWKAAGIVFHSFENITQIGATQEGAHAETSSNGGGAPAINARAKGQLKMLMQANQELSSQLNELRRTYLKELTEHRDRQRRWSEQAGQALDSLVEQPVMFFEPLNFVLDETSKDFVRAVVEERIKLDLCTGVDHRALLGPQDEEIQRDKDFEEEEDDKEAELAKALKALEKAAFERQRLEEKLARARAAAKEAKEKLQEQAAVFEETKQVLERERRESQDLRVRFDSCDLSGDLDSSLKEQLAEKDRRIEYLSGRCEELEAGLAKKEAELGSLREKLKGGHGGGSSTAGSRGGQASAGAAEQAGGAKTAQQTKLLLEKSIQVERQQAENSKLQDELAAARAQLKAIENTNGASGAGAAGVEAMRNLEGMHAKEKEELQDEIRRLKAELKKLRGEGGVADEAKSDKTSGGDEGKLAKLQARLDELEERHEELERERDQLDHTCEELKALLAEKMSPEEFAMALEKIGTSKPKKRRGEKQKNCFERLYEDAERRMSEYRVLQERLRSAQEQTIRFVANKVRDQVQLERLNALACLQRASVVMNERFQEALTTFKRTLFDKENKPEKGTAEAGKAKEEVPVLPSQQKEQLTTLCTSCSGCGAAVRFGDDGRPWPAASEGERPSYQLLTNLNAFPAAATGCLGAGAAMYAGWSPLDPSGAAAVNPLDAAADAWLVKGYRVGQEILGENPQAVSSSISPHGRLGAESMVESCAAAVKTWSSAEEMAAELMKESKSFGKSGRLSVAEFEAFLDPHTGGGQRFGAFREWYLGSRKQQFHFYDANRDGVTTLSELTAACGGFLQFANAVANGSTSLSTGGGDARWATERAAAGGDRGAYWERAAAPPLRQPPLGAQASFLRQHPPSWPQEQLTKAGLGAAAVPAAAPGGGEALLSLAPLQLAQGFAVRQLQRSQPMPPPLAAEDIVSGVSPYGSPYGVPGRQDRGYAPLQQLLGGAAQLPLPQQARSSPVSPAEGQAVVSPMGAPALKASRSLPSLSAAPLPGREVPVGGGKAAPEKSRRLGGGRANSHASLLPQPEVQLVEPRRPKFSTLVQGREIPLAPS
eukprot:TRINITY_DN35894_c0_g1_i1.p1 TRINITY_DN35894_c0_g1~~TRINITY_DN35894_c0_g1_i1.p1  ORF type:complete len:1161 (-),score=406.47 TRINITY_DN35894_c0_g1_i1:84-3566(-)